MNVNTIFRKKTNEYFVLKAMYAYEVNNKAKEINEHNILPVRDFIFLYKFSLN